MRLKSIKLAGFKSFVDPTTVVFPGNLCAIVGPNGCGKSNIIDAVRWVMGESSARQLRGEALTDVIFNGSSARQPTSMASIELLFDNSDGRIGGEYAAFGEIAIRRQVSRDAQSTYFLNGNRCRRRDIMDVFLGTGFGPRSYSIIEQGMISELVEARPEELRVFLEEAAGISKYKERRRETETRIRHTRENLSRLSDLREELGRQLTHLERQAEAAERYQALFTEVGQVRLELLVLRWRGLGEDIAREAQVVRELEVSLEAALARQRRSEADMEAERAAQTMANERFNVVQGEYYSLGAELARVEQDIELRTRRGQALSAELARLVERLRDLIDQQAAASATLAAELAGRALLLPSVDGIADEDAAGQAQLADAVQLADQARARFESATQASADHQRQLDVAASRVEHLQELVQRLEGRRVNLQTEQEQIDPDAQHGAVTSLEARVVGMDTDLLRTRQQLAEVNDAVIAIQTLQHQREQAVVQARNAYQDAARESATLAAVQQAALGRRDNAAIAWFESAGLVDRARLGEALSVTSGWERALETVLGGALRAAVVDDLDRYAPLLATLARGEVMLVSGERRPSHAPTSTAPTSKASTSKASTSTASQPTLAEHVRWDHEIGGLLNGVFIAEDVQAALALRASLAAGESVVTRDGVWVGADWIRTARGEHVEEGILERGQRVARLRGESDQRAAELDQAEQALAAARRELRDLEMQRGVLQETLVEDNRVLGLLRADASVRRVRLDELRAQRTRLGREYADIVAQIATERRQSEQHRDEVTQLGAQSTQLRDERAAALAARDTTNAAVTIARDALAAVRERLHALQLQQQAADARVLAAETAVARLGQTQGELTERQAALLQEQHSLAAPLPELTQTRQHTLASRARLETDLAQVRGEIDSATQRVRALDEERGEAMREGGETRATLDHRRLAWQDLRTRRGGIADQIGELGGNVEVLSGKLDATALPADWETRLTRLEQRIARLGPINLAAIDEYKTQFERKSYLDAQDADLVSAMATLENAIRQIDRETRARFKDTFEQVNARFQQLFPKVFGGGSASLELTGEDLLDTGVTLMARPPGKRNASIHLLSGGEKALTAVALIMSIFHLNPSPVCMLDEVDAPLDDANVGRYAELIKEMSSDVQFIFVTHNKIAMEMADQLLGVTMQEPGVSRLVSVDVERAVALAAT